MPLTDAEWDAADGLALADLVRRGAVTARELAEAALARIDRHDGRIGAVVRTDPEGAFAEIGRGLPDGPFRGVPFLLKEVGPGDAGRPITSNSRFFDGNVAKATGTIVERHRAAGLVILGRTNSPELGLCPATEPAFGRPTRNPWDPERQAGGSSGGAAAAVAARYVPMAQGGDGGGSIRLPAAHCGVYGLKPTRGRTPAGPLAGESWSGLVCTHALTRTVRDSAALLDATHGPAPGDPYAAPPPVRPYLAEVLRADPGRLGVAMVTAAPGGGRVDPAVVAAVEATGRLLAGLGHAVEPWAMPFDLERHADDFWLVVGTAAAAQVAARTAAIGRPPREDELEPVTRALVDHANRASAVAHYAAIQRLHLTGRDLGAVFARYDVILSPVFADPPLPLGRFSMATPSLDDYVAEARAGMPFTSWYNAAGCPAASLPLGWTADGLPIGVQIACAHGRDDRVLALSAQLEAAAPWAARRPGVTGRG
jgi:Asp-tRNA(Asn)/Glu-tRNA(Gln) amidotransferase A subunit family amidase